MNQHTPTCGDAIIDNIEYMSDLLESMLQISDKIRRVLPSRDQLREIATSDDFKAINELNKVMSSAFAINWALENANTTLVNLANDLNP